MRPQTYQVPRSEFDRILMDRAREAGVDVRERHRVIACDFTPDAAVLEVTRNDEERFTMRVRALVDATGRQGLLAKKFNLRTDEPRLANIAIFSHYANVPLIEGERPNDIRIVARADSGWFWLIPISAELMSVGVVLPKNLFLQMPDGTNEERLDRAIADTPLVARLMKDARREWPVRVEKDFSFDLRRRSVDSGRRCRFFSRSCFLDRRVDRDGIRNRSGRRARSRCAAQ